MIYTYSDASCSKRGSSWGGAMIGPDGRLVLCSGALPASFAVSAHAELEAALRVIELAAATWTSTHIRHATDNDEAAGKLQSHIDNTSLSHSRNSETARRLVAVSWSRQGSVRWLPRESPEIQLCDALADQVLAPPERARFAHERVLVRLGMAVVTPGGPWSGVLQGTVHGLHRLRRAGTRWQWPGGARDFTPAGYLTNRMRDLIRRGDSCRVG